MSNAEPPGSARPGPKLLGHFELLDFIGHGGFGEVWKARDIRLGRIVAIKRIPEEFLRDPQRKERFRREAESASALNHPNICTIYDFAEADGESLLVMEYVEGKTLHDALAAGPLPVEEAVPIAIQIAEGLAEAHRCGILHRDIKTSNIVLTATKRVKILDFGLARPFTVDSEMISAQSTEMRLTQEGVAVGTLRYMSPEQLLGKPLDPRSDLFSFGIVLYELLTGRAPFEGSSPVAVSDAILHHDPPPLSSFPGIPKDLDRVVRKMLAKDPEQRHRSADEVFRDLSSVLGGAGLSFQAVPRISLVRLAAISGSILVLAAVLGGWWWRHSSRIRWARNLALPEIARLAESEQYAEAVGLARRAEKIIPADPILAKMWPQISNEVSIQSEPPGAEVFFARYGKSEPQWERIGTTPMKNTRFPLGSFYRWKFEKAGYEPAFRLWPFFRGRELKISLIERGLAPPEMILVPLQKFSLRIPGLDHLEAVELGDFLMDRFEVTNEQYKQFVEQGGYQKRAYWKHPFIKDGRTLSWEETISQFGDATGRPGPANWELGDYPPSQEKYPVGGVSWFEAAAYAEFAGKRLPSIYHWNAVAETRASFKVVPLSNFREGGTVPVGESGLNDYGTYGMAGNVKEWCSNEAEAGKRYILGGGTNEPDYMFRDQDAQSAWRRLPGFGFRCMKVVRGEVPAAADRAIWIPLRDFSKEKPVSDPLFKAYLSLYSYDKEPLESVVESVDRTPEGWTLEKISFDAAYGNERMIAYLYLPKNARPPFQTVIFFPGSNAIHTNSIGSSPGIYAEFIPKSGRALVYPIYKGTFERRDALNSDYPAPTSFYRDHVLAWAKDMGRTIDYLETRKDLDHQKLAYYGYSWGGVMGAIMPAVEPRLKTCVFGVGGLLFQRALPEVDQINFVTRVKQPVLMLNSRYDQFLPVETASRRMYELLGTPPKDKRFVLYESGHALPRNELVKESLKWLDHYLGPVSH